MQELLKFLSDFFDDPRRYLGCITLFVAIMFAYGWAENLNSSQGEFEAIQLVYGVVTIPLTLVSAWLILAKPSQESSPDFASGRGR